MTTRSLPHAHFPLIVGFAILSLMVSGLLIHLPSPGIFFFDSSNPLRAIGVTPGRDVGAKLPVATLYIQVLDAEGQAIHDVHVKGRPSSKWTFTSFHWDPGAGVDIYFAPGVPSLSPGLLVYWTNASGEPQSVLVWISHLKPGDSRQTLIRASNDVPPEIQEVDRGGDFFDRLDRLRD